MLFSNKQVLSDFFSSLPMILVLMKTCAHCLIVPVRAGVVHTKLGSLAPIWSDPIIAKHFHCYRGQITYTAKHF